MINAVIRVSSKRLGEHVRDQPSFGVCRDQRKCPGESDR